MIVVFKQVFVLFLFAFIGYVLSKSGRVKSDHGSVLSALLVNVFFPCKVFKSFASNLSIQVLSERYISILTCVIVLLAIVLFSTFFVKLLTKKDYEQRVLKYSMIIANSGYMGYALVESLYGDAALFEMMIYAMPVSVYTYTGGYCLLLKKKLTMKKLVNPVTIAMLLGAVWGISGLKLPVVFETVLSQSGSCTGPVSMLLTGIAVSQYKFKEMLVNKNIYIVTLMRLIAIPFAVGMILKPFCAPQIVMSAVLVTCMPCGLNGVVFPKLVNEDCRTGAGLVMVSTILACITIPVCVHFLLG